MRSTVKSLPISVTSGFFSNSDRSAKGILVRSSWRPLSVTRPSWTNSGSPAKIDSGNSSPRGILMPNSRSSRKTMSRKSMDSAPRSPWSVEEGLISSSSTFRASTSVADTFEKISSWVGMDQILQIWFPVQVSYPHPPTVFCSGGQTRMSAPPRTLTRHGPQAEAAIHGNDLAGNVSALGPGQEHHHACDVLRLTKAAHRDQLFNHVPGLVADRRAHVRLDEAGGDRVDGDIPAGQFHRQGSGERIDGPLAGRVIRLARVHMVGGDARNIDDPAAPLLHHRVRHRPAEVKHSPQVGLEHAVPGFGVHPHEQIIMNDPGVIDQD